jgi:hypothetical protein
MDKVCILHKKKKETRKMYEMLIAKPRGNVLFIEISVYMRH